MASRTLVVLAVAALGALAGCTTTHNSSGTTSSTAAVAAAEDPLTEVDDTASSDFVDGHLPPVLHAQGVGAGTFSVHRPSGTPNIRFYVTCSAESHYRVTMGTAAAFTAGPCGSSVENWAEIPLHGGSGPLQVTVDVPDGVRYWVLGLPVEGHPTGS